MCGRFTLRHPRRIRSWGIPEPDLFEVQPRFNIAPSQKILAITANELRLHSFDWGLVPSWSKEATGFINARAETLADKPSFTESFLRRRCLIPADGFFEWKRCGSDKQPYYFQLKDESLFAFAGIWDVWQYGELRVLSCAIITTTPNELLSSIHDRMPVMLQPESHDVWLNSRTPVSELKRMLNPFPAEEMKSHPVGSDVNYVKIDAEHLVLPVEETTPAQASLF